MGVLRIAVALACVAQGAIGSAQVRDADMRDAAGEAAAKQALETFITEWNTADDANLQPRADPLPEWSRSRLG